MWHLKNFSTGIILSFIQEYNIKVAYNIFNWVTTPGVYIEATSLVTADNSAHFSISGKRNKFNVEPAGL